MTKPAYIVTIDDKGSRIAIHQDKIQTVEVCKYNKQHTTVRFSQIGVDFVIVAETFDEFMRRLDN